MKPADWDVLDAYIRRRADELGLRDWTILVRQDPPAHPEALAEVRPTEGRKHAVIRVCVGFRELTDEEQRSVVIHELLHCHLAQIQLLTSSDSALGTMLGLNNHGALGPVALAIEYAVDGIADAIAPSYPHIIWTSDDPSRADSANAPYEGPIDKVDG